MTPHLSHLGKSCGNYGCSNLGSFGRHPHVTAVPPQHPLECWVLSLGNTPLKLPYLLAHTSDWKVFKHSKLWTS